MALVLHAGCGVLVEGLMCSHMRMQSGCCAVVVTSLWLLKIVGRLRVIALVRCCLCV